MENVRNFENLNKYLIKYYILYKKCFFLEIIFFMFSADFIFVVLHLKIRPAIQLSFSKALTLLLSKRKAH